MTYKQKEIDTFLKAYADFDKEQLLRERDDKAGAPRVAIDILLERLAQKDTETKYKETLTEARRASKFAKWAVIVGVLSLLAFAIDFSYRHFHSKDESKQHTEEIKTKPIQQPPSKAISEPQNDQSHKQPLKSKSTEK